jgi:hypothetical protein
MAKIKCSIEEDMSENDYGTDSPCIIATCSKCDHVTESFGTGEPSIKRCLALMNEECPYNESNLYAED